MFSLYEVRSFARVRRGCSESKRTAEKVGWLIARSARNDSTFVANGLSSIVVGSLKSSTMMEHVDVH